MEAAAHIEGGEWRSHLPDSREVVVRRRGEHWLVRCGHSLARSENLDVALARAIRADNKVTGYLPEFDYAAWIRGVAHTLVVSSASPVTAQSKSERGSTCASSTEIG
jgi:hypothetical protein